jgi:hypothetical protein
MKAPKSPDPMATAAAQGASNRETAITQQMLNMTNQVTPDGSLNYNQTGNATFTGADGRPVNTPTFTATQTLSPAQQRLYDQNVQADTGMNDIALGQIDRIGGHLKTPFNYNPGEHEKWAGDLYGKLNDDTNQRNMGLMENKLANQGLQPGTPAYDDAMRNLIYGQEKGRNDFMLGSYDTGMNTALTMRNQPLNEVSSLMSGTGVQQPQFASTPQTGVNGTDVAGLINQDFQTRNQNYQNKMGGLFGLGSAALGGWAMSDRRLKTDIKKVGETPIKGVNAYSFRYKGSPFMQLGAMAQEVIKKVPDAVGTMANGFKAVNYGRLAEAMGA